MEDVVGFFIFLSPEAERTNTIKVLASIILCVVEVGRVGVDMVSLSLSLVRDYLLLPVCLMNSSLLKAFLLLAFLLLALLLLNG